MSELSIASAKRHIEDNKLAQVAETFAEIERTLKSWSREAEEGSRTYEIKKIKENETSLVAKRRLAKYGFALAVSSSIFTIAAQCTQTSKLGEAKSFSQVCNIIRGEGKMAAGTSALSGVYKVASDYFPKYQDTISSQAQMNSDELRIRGDRMYQFKGELSQASDKSFSLLEELLRTNKEISRTILGS
ncbi:MAG: hypothetical protein ACI9S8_001135 [Chlamydiales bacterium]|jgi:hypothetical protein